MKKMILKLFCLLLFLYIGYAYGASNNKTVEANDMGLSAYADIGQTFNRSVDSEISVENLLYYETEKGIDGGELPEVTITSNYIHQNVVNVKKVFKENAEIRNEFGELETLSTPIAYLKVAPLSYQTKSILDIINT